MRKCFFMSFLVVMLLTITSCSKKIEVTLNVNGDKEVVEIKKGESLGDKHNPNIEGMTFEGWYLDSSFINYFDVSSNIEENITLYAKFSKQITVTLVIDGESSVINVPEGTKISDLEKKQIEEKQFVGWYYNQEYTQFAPVNSVLDSDITLYAKYIGVIYTITFDSNGGNDIKSVKYSSGETPEAPLLNPSKLGYEFSYWSLDKEGNNVYDFTKPMNKNFTLYANYVEVSYQDLLDSIVPDVINDSIILPIGEDSLEYNWEISNPEYLSYNGIYNPDTIDREVSVTLIVNVKGSDETLSFTKNTTVKKYELKKLVDGDIVIGYTSSWYYNGYSDEVLNTVDVLNISFAYVLEDASLNLNDITKLLVETVGAGHRNGVRVCLSVQGYGEETKNFSDCAADNTLRVKLAKSMVDVVVKYRLDGVDIDWEYPGSYSGRGFVEDRANYTLLIKEIRKQLDAINKDYLLTAAIPAGPWGHNNFDLEELSNYFDYINMMSYDLQASSTGTHHTALYPSDVLSGTASGCSVDETITIWTSKGVPLNKIVLGIAFYGKDIRTNNSKNGGLGVSAAAGASYKNSAYTKICDSYFSLIGTKVNYYFDYSSCSPYMYNTEKRLFFTYDNELSIIYKCEYAKSKGLGGVMIWEIGEDNTNTLITAVAQGMDRHLDNKYYIIGGNASFSIGDEITVKTVKEVSDTALKESLIYTISDESIATIEGNVVKFIKSGTVIIKAINKDNGTVYGDLTIVVK